MAGPAPALFERGRMDTFPRSFDVFPDSRHHFPMDIQNLLKSLRREFPGRNIVLLPPEDPNEIIMELDRDEVSGTAIALIRRSKPHIHRYTKERYIVESGSLILEIDSKSSVLREGDRTTIAPGKVHRAMSVNNEFARVRVISWPPWSPDDHILV
jgi:mannose-6-phosphate isomerase-like protein (cupin superfamily)